MTVSNSAGKVTVACRLPHGVFLQAYRQVEDSEPIPGGGTRTFTRPEPVGAPVRIRGYYDDIKSS